MAKSRSKISRQPVKKSKKPAARKSAPAKTAAKTAPKGKWVYSFGGGKAAGRAGMRNLLGGKGAGLAEMAHLGLPVPPGFTITTEVCTYFYQNGKTYPKDLKPQVEAALAEVGRIAGKTFGDAKNPLLVSVRSGARASMPGMLDTVLNLGLNDVTVAALAEKSGDRRFAYDSYRRFITMYSDVVLGIAHHHFEEILDEHKDRNGYTLDTDLEADDWEQLVARYKERVEKERGEPFPQDPHAQLWGAIGAVFGSWMNHRAITYRRLHGLPESWGTAVNVQAMVFGNLGETSATGVAFTRNPSTGEKKLYGEFLINAQGEDVVAGIRTPQEITEEARKEAGSDKPSMETALPHAFAELKRVYAALERHYRDMQDLEFTVEQGKLWMLQTRSGKRTAKAALRIAVELAQEKLISKEEAVTRVDPAALDQLLHPTIDPEAERKVIATGLPASPGAACGEIVFSSEEAELLKSQGHKVILVRIETSPEDIHGMHAAEGILTTRGGMTSHAAVVARGMGKPCVSGAGALRVDYRAQTLTAGGTTLKKGEILTIDGSTGQVLAGKVAMREPELAGEFATLMKWADAARKLKVRANADTPADARAAIKFGAEGIGLCRTEHMFFDEDRIRAVREMILAGDETGAPRRARQAPADAAGGFRRAVQDHGRPARDHPPARSAAARIPAAHRGGDRSGGAGHGRGPAKTRRPRPRAARVQSDARLPRLPAGDRLSGDRGNAGARHLRGRGRGRPRDRRRGGAGDHGAAHRRQGRTRFGQGTHRRHGRDRRRRDQEQDQISGRHHDRAAARGIKGRRDRRDRRILFFRHQRSDADHFRHQPRRCGELFGHLHRRRAFWRSTRSCRSTARASANSSASPPSAAARCGRNSSSASAASTAAIPPRSRSATRLGSTTCPARRSACRSRDWPPLKPRWAAAPVRQHNSSG